jgi:hypothetical protein
MRGPKTDAVIAWDEKAPEGWGDDGGVYAADTEVSGHGGEEGTGPEAGPAGQNEATRAGSSTCA